MALANWSGQEVPLKPQRMPSNLATTLRVAVAAAVKLHILDNAVLDFKLDGLAASALGSVGIFHWISVF